MVALQKSHGKNLAFEEVQELQEEVARWKLQAAQALKKWCFDSGVGPKALLQELDIGPAGKHIFSATSICRTPEDLYARLCLRTRLRELDPRSIPPMLRKTHRGHEAISRAWADERFDSWLKERGTTLNQLERDFLPTEVAENPDQPDELQEIVAAIEELGGSLIVGDAISFLNKVIPPYLQCGEQDILDGFREDHGVALERLRENLNSLLG